MKGLWCVILSISLVLTFCGCDQVTPLKDKLIVEGIAIDKQEDAFLVTLQVYLPSSDTKGGSSHQMFSGTGETVYAALSKIDEDLGKISFYADTKVILISKEALAQGLWQVIDPFVRSSEMGSNVCMAAVKGKAAELFGIEQEGNLMPAQILANGLRYGSSANAPVSGELMQVAAGLEDDAATVAIPMVGVEEKDEKKTPVYQGILCFQGDRPYYEMNQEMKWVYNWLNDYRDGRGWTVTAGENRVSLLFRQTKTKVTARVEQGVPHFTLTVEATCEVTESNRSLTQQGVIQVAQAAGADMKRQIGQTLQIVVNQKGCDVFRLGKNMKKQQSEYFKSCSSWQEVCKTARFTVDAQVDITRVGQQALS